MGRQINFYLAEDDEEPFEVVLRSAGSLVVLPTSGGAAEPQLLPTTKIQKMGEEPLTLFLAQDPALLASRIPAGVFRYRYDVMTKPVVEFSRCYRAADFIRRGRLYFVTKYFDADNNLTSKPEAFTKWGDRLLRKARTWLKRIDASTYAGPAASRAAEAGITLKSN